MSEPERSRTGAAPPWLIGVILLVGLAVVLAAVVPMVECPDTWYHARVVDASIRGKPYPPCDRCQGRGRVTLINRWLKGPGGEPGSS
jgi:hypothetical protein